MHSDFKNDEKSQNVQTDKKPALGMDNTIKKQQALPKRTTQNWDYSRTFGNCTPNTAIDYNIRITYVNSFYFRGLNDADMEISVLDIQFLKSIA